MSMSICKRETERAGLLSRSLDNLSNEGVQISVHALHCAFVQVLRTSSWLERLFSNSNKQGTLWYYKLHSRCWEGIGVGTKMSELSSTFPAHFLTFRVG